MKKKLNQGFTLIELLVVIAIIGILASVVLASLNSARAKGSDAAVKSSINNARAQAEIFYDSQTPNGYRTGAAGVCAQATGILPMLTAADNANGGGAATCNSTDLAWAMSAQLVSITSPVTYYCVDSTGASRNITTALGAAVVCPAS